MDEELVLYKKLSENAKTPHRSTPRSAGLDLFSAESTVVFSRSQVVIKTDISIALPIGTYGRIASRSGLALKHGISVLGGVVDPDYNGNLKVILNNNSGIDFYVVKGQRIAQLIIEKICMGKLVEVSSLPETQRNCMGFGSTEIREENNEL